METKACWRKGRACRLCERLVARCATLPIELKSEWSAKRGKGAFGGIGFCGLQGDVVNFTR